MVVVVVDVTDIADIIIEIRILSVYEDVWESHVIVWVAAPWSVEALLAAVYGHVTYSPHVPPDDDVLRLPLLLPRPQLKLAKHPLAAVLWTRLPSVEPLDCGQQLLLPQPSPMRHAEPLVAVAADEHYVSSRLLL